MSVKISVILPVFNEASYIRPTIDSLLDQTIEQEYEILAIDDGSTDGTTDIIREYVDDYEHVSLTENEENKGITRCLNRGIEKANGRYIARQDGNDISVPTRLQRQYDFLEANEDIELVGTSCVDINESGAPFGSGRTVPTAPETIAAILPHRNPLIHTSILFRNSGWQYRKKFHYTQDYDLYLRMVTAGEKLANIDAQLVKSRHNPGHIGDSKGNVQRLFGDKAVEFYHQRCANGHDEYDSFDPDRLYEVATVEGEPHPHRKNMYIYLKNGNAFGAWREFLRSARTESNSMSEITKALFVLTFPPIYRYCRNDPQCLRSLQE